jgi:hypothetical protein
MLTKAQNGEAWWNDIDFDNENFIALTPATTLTSSNLNGYSHLMQEYFSQKSRAPSPSPNKAASMWYSAPACLLDHDLEIVNIFLNIFARNIPSYFTLFQDLSVTSDTRPEYTLAAAAVGGLYCTIAGSFELSKSMYNDSRRLLLSLVSVEY